MGVFDAKINYSLRRARVKDLRANTGQIPGVPKNPRVRKDGKFDALKKSLAEFPDMLALREIVAYDNGGEPVVVGGNMRLAALKDLGAETVPVKILAGETPPEVVRRFVITDNTPYGEWDWDALAGEWDGGELSDWGCDGWAEESASGENSDTIKDAKPVKTLAVGDFSVPLTDTEYDALKSELVSYIGENVIPDGFFAKILGIENEAPRGLFFFERAAGQA
jgi:hypothetical protein